MCTVLARLARRNYVITAEHHQLGEYEHSMPDLLRVTGNGHHVQIHCATELSAMRLFNEVVALAHLGIAHPFTRTLRELGVTN